MNRRFLMVGLIGTLALTGLAAVVSPAALRPARGQRPVAHEGHDFVFLAESRPLLIRLHVRQDGKPVQAAWDEFIKTLFDHLDIDGDGVLNKSEAERVPSLDQIMTGGLGGVFGGFGLGSGMAKAPTLEELDTNNDGMVTMQELASYYRRKGFEPVQFQLASAVNPVAAFLGGQRRGPSEAAIAEAVFKALDTNKDGKLTREELAAAPEILLRLDANDDELVTVQELVPDAGGGYGGKGMMGGGMMGGPGGVGGTKSDQLQLLVPVHGKATEDLLNRLQKRYGPADAKEIKLTREQIGLDDATFAQLDKNHDGVLDRDELAGFVNRTPDVELKMLVGDLQGAKHRVEMHSVKDSPLAHQIHSKHGVPLLDMGRTRVDLRVTEQDRADLLGGIVRQQVAAQFKQADKEKKGYLDQKQAEASPLFKGMFKQADRDGDGKLTEKELTAYLDRMGEFQKLARGACVTLVALDQSRGLFDLLDENRDGRLSVYEMRQAVKLLDRVKGKGFLTREDMPHSYRLMLRNGPVDTGNDFASALVELYRGGDASEQPPEPTAGPLWFRKMDRNRDGFVSRREFLGTDEEFRQIDTDGDGLISVEEAERFDARVRGKK
jgi:Ca2+-binding EF-hand superfamily protein